MNRQGTQAALIQHEGINWKEKIGLAILPGFLLKINYNTEKIDEMLDDIEHCVNCFVERMNVIE